MNDKTECDDPTGQNGNGNGHSDKSHCEGSFDGQISGRIMLECDCCHQECPKLKTTTTIIQVPPQTETSFDSWLQAQVDAVENSGKLVMAHSIVDAGAGWIVGLTVGEYV